MYRNINVGFSPCKGFFQRSARIQGFFRSLFSPCSILNPLASLNRPFFAHPRQRFLKSPGYLVQMRLP
jgi:hypothetical protein